MRQTAFSFKFRRDDSYAARPKSILLRGLRLLQRAEGWLWLTGLVVLLFLFGWNGLLAWGIVFATAIVVEAPEPIETIEASGD